MKFSVFTAMLPEFTVEQTIDLLMRQGFEGVEWRLTTIDPARLQETPSFWGNNLSTINTNSTVEQLELLKGKLKANDLEISNLACYLQFGDLQGVERDMKTAQLLGAKSIRIGFPAYDRTRNYNELFKEAYQFLNEVIPLGQQYGIKPLIEIHMRSIAVSAGLAYRLVEDFDPAMIGIIYDPGNMVFEGYENYRMGLELLGDYLAHVHVKNMDWTKNPASDGSTALWECNNASLREGVVDWQQVIIDLKSVGYDGWLSFEDFSKSAPTKQLLKDNMAYIKSLL